MSGSGEMRLCGVEGNRLNDALSRAELQRKLRSLLATTSHHTYQVNRYVCSMIQKKSSIVCVKKAVPKRQAFLNTQYFNMLFIMMQT